MWSWISTKLKPDQSNVKSEVAHHRAAHSSVQASSSSCSSSYSPSKHSYGCRKAKMVSPPSPLRACLNQSQIFSSLERDLFLGKHDPAPLSGDSCSSLESLEDFFVQSVEEDDWISVEASNAVAHSAFVALEAKDKSACAANNFLENGLSKKKKRVLSKSSLPSVPSKKASCKGGKKQTRSTSASSQLLHSNPPQNTIILSSTSKRHAHVESAQKAEKLEEHFEYSFEKGRQKKLKKWSRSDLRDLKEHRQSPWKIQDLRCKLEKCALADKNGNGAKTKLKVKKENFLTREKSSRPVKNNASGNEQAVFGFPLREDVQKDRKDVIPIRQCDFKSKKHEGPPSAKSNQDVHDHVMLLSLCNGGLIDPVEVQFLPELSLVGRKSFDQLAAYNRDFIPAPKKDSLKIHDGVKHAAAMQVSSLEPPCKARRSLSSPHVSLLAPHHLLQKGELFRAERHMRQRADEVAWMGERSLQAVSGAWAQNKGQCRPYGCKM